MILFSGHIGSWELLPALLGQNGMPMASFYRAAANPEVDAMINAMRRVAVGCRGAVFQQERQGRARGDAVPRGRRPRWACWSIRR